MAEAVFSEIKLYFTMPPDTAKAIISFVDKRVPVTGHLGYTHSLDVIRAGIDGLEHCLDLAVQRILRRQHAVRRRGLNDGSELLDPSD